MKNWLKRVELHCQLARARAAKEPELFSSNDASPPPPAPCPIWESPLEAPAKPGESAPPPAFDFPSPPILPAAIRNSTR